MLRSNDCLRLVMIDFGLALETSFIPANVLPTGSQTHYSPEKAASKGYDFGADVWAAVAVLVHMLSGSEPWIKRYTQTPHLHYIVSQCVNPFLLTSSTKGVVETTPLRHLSSPFKIYIDQTTVGFGI